MAEPVLLLVMVIPLGISGLIIYSSYTARRMEYILGDDELRVNFPVSPLRLGYRKIKSAGRVEASLRFRLFGGSLPGAYFGTFKTSIGDAQVYATRHSGDFIILELTEGERILISPRDLDAFLEALSEKTEFDSTTLTKVMETRLDGRIAFVQVTVVSIAWLILAAYVASIYPGLPDVIPVHFGLNGIPNRYGSKVEILVLVAVSTLFPVLNAVFAVKFGKYNKGLTAFLGAVFFLAVGLFALVVNQILQAI